MLIAYAFWEAIFILNEVGSVKFCNEKLKFYEKWSKEILQSLNGIVPNYERIEEVSLISDGFINRI